LAFDRFGTEPIGQPAILFLHGWCENRGFWRPTAEVFGAQAFCISVDLPGHGASTVGESAPDPVEWGARLARLAGSLHDGPWVVVGHSLGGVIALETGLALQAEQQAAGVVVVHGLYDPDRKFDAAMNREFARALEADFDGQLKAFVEALVPPRTQGQLSDWVADQMQKTDPAVAVAGLGALENYDVAACLQRLKVPVRAINATMRATNMAANRRLIDDFDLYLLDSIEGPGLDLMLQDPVGFRALLHRALGDMNAPTQP
jgi:pimeloyl-ACP methyl ester carboxylesterase